MKKKNVKRIITLVLTFLFIFNSFAFADTSVVVTLGKDLNQDQRKQILDIFDVEEDKTTIIEINNQEERRYLEGVASEAQLGTRTISSAYVELLDDGSGITVDTYNITWVTKEMYQSALVTAGVKDAKVIAAAPFPVSGTGALTGIIKAFEEVTGQELSEEQKKVANEEIVTSGELGEAIGKDKAAKLIKEVKEEIISKAVKDPEEIKRIIIEISGKLDINLNDEQLQSLQKLMEKIGKLDLDTSAIKDQLKNIGEKLDETLRNNEEVKSLLQRILDAIVGFFKSIFGGKN
ncbi:MAG: DUF1002 domain-containing protein [Tissierellaceae bacterium]|nr:DUF1002 domain-containing protein [Tissierellia bacterium]